MHGPAIVWCGAVALFTASCWSGGRHPASTLHIERHGHVSVALSDDDASPAACALPCLETAGDELADCLARCPTSVGGDGPCPPADGATRVVCAPRSGELSEQRAEACRDAVRHVAPGDVVLRCEDVMRGGAGTGIIVGGMVAGSVLLVLGAVAVLTFPPHN